MFRCGTEQIPKPKTGATCPPDSPSRTLCENRKTIDMPVLRTTFIALSRNPTLRSFSESSSIGRKMSSRFVAGLEVDDVLHAAESVNSQGISATLDSLGENVATPDEARHSADVYHRLLDDIKSRGLNANVSVKLTQMGLELDPELTEEIAASLVAHAVETNNFVRIDMESSAVTQVTLDIVKRLHVPERAEASPNRDHVGVASSRLTFTAQRERYLRANGRRNPHPPLQGRLRGAAAGRLRRKIRRRRQLRPPDADAGQVAASITASPPTTTP